MRKNTKKTFLRLSISITVCIITVFSQYGFAQDKHPNNGRYLVINYESTALSPLLIDILNKQVLDQSERNKIISKIGEQKYHFILAYDTKSRITAYYLDSATLVSGVNSGGNYEFVLKESDGKTYGKESVAGATHYFEGNISKLNWEITNETRKIGKYNCTKAVLKNLQHCAVWFTLEVPIMVGPEIYDGLPGLVVETETAFDQTNIQSIRYTDEITDIISHMQKFRDEIGKVKLISIDKVFKSKNNMITMMLNRAKS